MSPIACCRSVQSPDDLTPEWTRRRNRPEVDTVPPHRRTDAREHAHFLALLAETCTRYEWLVRTYCLMGNHYAQWLSWRHGHKGHAFFRRFGSVLIKTDSQLAEVARYILLNPVRAHLCKTADEWPWSSYRAMIGKEPMPPFPTSDWLLAEFGVGIEQARVNFAAFIRAAE